MSSAIEGWILAGQLSGRAAVPAPLRPICGVPHLLRDALTLKTAGVERVRVIWAGSEPVPDVSELAEDVRLRGLPLEITREVPVAPEGRVVVVRGDRLYHRDIPRDLARTESDGVVAVAGDEYDAVFAVPGELARELALAAPDVGGLAGVIAERRAAGAVTEIEPPYRGFTVAINGSRDVRRGSHLLVTSLRKPGDGLMSRYNRYVSLFLSSYLCRLPIRPNHVTSVCFLLALAGGIVIAQGGYTNAVLGMLLLEAGSVLDGCDGELSRLKSWGSQLGQWMDTVTDDFGNLFFLAGTAFNLDAAGASWAWPVAIVAMSSFFITQASQYYIIAVVYGSGDLAAIPWAFQAPPDLAKLADESWTDKIKRNVPRMLKRDFFLTVFVGLTLLGRIDVAFLIFSAGAVSFLIAFAIQFTRWKLSKSDQPDPA